MSMRHKILHGMQLCIHRSLFLVATLLLVAGLSTAAYADTAGGQISGTVTDTSTDAGIGNILVEAFGAVSDYQNNIDPIADTTTNATGAYTLDLPDGNYMIAFNDLRNGSYNPTYYQQFYNNVSYYETPEALSLVTVASGSVTPDINAWLTPLIPTTTTLSSSPNPSVAGQQVTYTAQVSTNVGQGMMVFKDGGQLMFAENCAFTFFTGDTATCTVTYATSGTHAITAQYVGDAVYAPSAVASLDQTVAPNAPTSKDQCKHGGWKYFTNPSFKNQGQCVSYVEHHS